ncbi:MAG: FHA domain-containing protein [Anaerolineales bacterium]
MTDSFRYMWIIEIFVVGMRAPVRLNFSREIVLGRNAGGRDHLPDVDLSPYGAEEGGVSRQHLTIYAENDTLYAVDMGSQNGTRLNDTKLVPNTPYELDYLNHFSLGDLQVEVRVVVTPRKGNQIHMAEHQRIALDTYRGNGERVLIVEDDPEIAKAFSLIIARGGYDPIITHEVLGAMRAYNRNRPAAIVLDLMLPDMNGLELCRYVRRDVENNATPIVVVSAFPSDDKVHDAMDAGVDVFLQKPVSTQELLEVVSSLVRQSSAGRKSLSTKRLVGTAPLQEMPPQQREDTVVMFVGGFGDAPLTIPVSDTVSFGREATEQSLRTHIDLTEYNAADLGVSRMHMYLHKDQGKYFIEDAGSTNGTFRNGSPVKRHELAAVQNGDEIRLGNLRLYIYFTNI